MKISFYWSDQFYLLIVFIGLISLIMQLRQQQARETVLKILKKPSASCSIIILGFFLSISLLDSIHMTLPKNQNSTAGLTALDWGLYPLGQVYEKSYSKPLSLHLFNSEVRINNGDLIQSYPRLIYPPTTLISGKDVMKLVLNTSLKSLVVTLITTVLLYGAVHFWAYWGFNIRRWQMPRLMIPPFVTFICLVLIGSFIYLLSRQLHVLGTGKIGEDILYYSIKSIRTGLVIGLVTTLVMMPLAVGLGIIAGFFGGWWDDVIQYLYTTLSSVPGVLLITAAILAFETFITNHPDSFHNLSEMADARLLALCLILGLTSWTSLCRLIRAEVLKLREMEYVLAAIALGSSSFRIIMKHLLPNVMHLVLMTLVLDFSFLVLAEAVLSYVGVGVSPMTMSWGNMINAARLELAQMPMVWWPVLSAFILMFLLVLSSNLLADVLQEALDPHERASQ